MYVPVEKLGLIISKTIYFEKVFISIMPFTKANYPLTRVGLCIFMMTLIR
jgi:hypothetical protein